MTLEVPQDERFQRAEWRLERVGWLLLTLFVVAGLAGLLGPGPLSWHQARSPSGLVSVEHQRVTHHEADDSIALAFAPDAFADGAVTVELTGSWVAGVDWQGVVPQPAEQRAVPGGVVLELPVARPGRTGLQITFRAQELGRLTGHVTVGEDRVSFSQLVLP